MNVIIARHNFSAQDVVYLSLFKVRLSSEYVLKQEFKSSTTPKITLFSLKNRKNLKLAQRPNLNKIYREICQLNRSHLGK